MVLYILGKAMIFHIDLRKEEKNSMHAMQLIGTASQAADCCRTKNASVSQINSWTIFKALCGISLREEIPNTKSIRSRRARRATVSIDTHCGYTLFEPPSLLWTSLSLINIYTLLSTLYCLLTHLLNVNIWLLMLNDVGFK